MHKADQPDHEFHEQPALAIIDLVMSEEWIILPGPDKTLQTYL